ncbi:MAG: prepilin-type N-terminal cleavage/methylation domain-containing protein [Acidobacteria bacterium]|nr:prepilin-type N-terminal cleavage/methylation domain-containing protein [Acidobacteriota bacterium]MBA3888253.1 prepilin-type N-terminal cleavage/methylation domain-containing protein [Acidobacteriota bacterium]
MTTRHCGTRGFTLIELLIVVAIVGILASLAMAGYRHARLSGNEAAAIGALQAINQAQAAFALTCGNQRYAPTLSSLGVPATQTGEAFLSPDLTSGDEVVKSGYYFAMAGTPLTEQVQACNGATPVEGYQVTADPVQPGVSGDRYFGTNAGRAIFAADRTLFEHMPETGDPPFGAEIR